MCWKCQVDTFEGASFVADRMKWTAERRLIRTKRDGITDSVRTNGTNENHNLQKNPEQSIS